MSASTTLLRRPALLVGRNRMFAVAGATVAAVAVWAMEVPVLGIQLATQFGNAAPTSVGLIAVILSALVGSLAGLGMLVLLEWRVARAHVIWTGVAIVALLASLALPLAAGTTTSAKLGLVTLHVAVGGVLILALRRG